MMNVLSFLCAISSKRLSGFSGIAFTGFIILYSLLNVASINTSNVWSTCFKQAMAHSVNPDNGLQGGGQF